jgi:hypothetical protein
MLNLCDQPIDGEHELLSVPIRAICQQFTSMCGEQIVASRACPALYVAIAQVCETSDITGTPCMPQGSKHVLERESGGNAVPHVAVQHNEPRSRWEPVVS